MAPNPDQPRKEGKENVAALAKVNRLKPHDNMLLISDYAKEFGRDPEKVYKKGIFATFTAYHIANKERSEYHERFSYIYQKISEPITKPPKS